MGAVRAARQHLEAGMRLAGEAAPTELLFDLGAALVADGASEEAIAIYERLLNLPELSTADRIAVLRQLGQASSVTGQVERTAACYESAVDLAEQEHPALAVGALLDQAFRTRCCSVPGPLYRGLIERPSWPRAAGSCRPRRRPPGARSPIAAATPRAW